jgi:hypothetical protein
MCAAVGYPTFPAGSEIFYKCLFNKQTLYDAHLYVDSSYTLDK